MGNCACTKDDQTSRSNFRTSNNRISFQSIIITQKNIYKKFDTQIIQKIANKLSNTPVQIRLIYRASQSGYCCQTFHQAADGVTNTLLIVKTNKKIFGAFTPCCWRKNSSYKYQVDQKQESFLFSLQGKKLQEQIQQDNQDQNNRFSDQNIKKQDKGIKKIDKMKEFQKKNKKGHTKQQLSFKFYKIKDKTKAIMNHSDSGPIYGVGHDIMIADKCNRNQNWCNIGGSYQSINKFGSIKANNELAGKVSFLIQQYEMWTFTI